MKDSIRDVIAGELTLEYFARRFSEGWKLASVEWVRESQDAEPSKPVSRGVLDPASAVPYGFQITDGCVLRENPIEAAVLEVVLDQIVQEKRIQEIAAELNRQHLRTREGLSWRAMDVFNLLPRLIEAGPSILKSDQWQRRPRPSQSLDVSRPAHLTEQ